MYIYNRLDEDGKVLTPEEILYRVCSSVCFIFFGHNLCTSKISVPVVHLPYCFRIFTFCTN